MGPLAVLENSGSRNFLHSRESYYISHQKKLFVSAAKFVRGRFVVLGNFVPGKNWIPERGVVSPSKIVKKTVRVAVNLRLNWNFANEKVVEKKNRSIRKAAEHLTKKFDVIIGNFS